jgi:hypothetical protein
MWRFVQFSAIFLVIAAISCIAQDTSSDHFVVVKQSVLGQYEQTISALRDSLKKDEDAIAALKQQINTLIQENAQLRAGITNTSGDVDPVIENGDPECKVEGYNLVYVIKVLDKCDSTYDAKLYNSEHHSSYSGSVDAGTYHDDSYYTDDLGSTETRPTDCKAHKIQVPVCRLKGN